MHVFGCSLPPYTYRRSWDVPDVADVLYWIHEKMLKILQRNNFIKNYLYIIGHGQEGD